MKARISLLGLFMVALVFSVCALGSSYFEMRGTVSALDAQSMVLSTNGGLIKIPRSVATRGTVRPGHEISVLIMGNTPIEALEGATKRELNRK